MSSARLSTLGSRIALRSSKTAGLPPSRLVGRRSFQWPITNTYLLSATEKSFSTNPRPINAPSSYTNQRKDSVFASSNTSNSPAPPGFDVTGRVYAVTGGGRGLGLTIASYLAKLGAHVYCLDVLHIPAAEFYETKELVEDCAGCGSLNYHHLDVRNANEQDAVFAEIADQHQRFDGLVAAAAIQHICLALEYPPEKITEMLEVNVKGVHLTATAAAKQMIKYDCQGSIVLIASMSGFISNKGLSCSVYNASKAAVISLGRSFADQWSKAVGGKPIRVNSLCPGNIMTPMVRKNFEDEPHLKQLWEDSNMLGRISEPEEFTGAVLFMLSDASSFMTGAFLLVDAGYTAW
ncbi:Short chain dehydrogenases/reductase notP' [Pseudocercospora fuligena]|uniref:Short chain dehydrogenases/reductase notP n=1 Tax=Pseudocercospora fuligena TaxID=685502 RepID=A0A8H6VE41_9PEZI|nr:Short chain dehydrogenases/reductase notP' [Pseudocercospora fuligena]